MTCFHLHWLKTFQGKVIDGFTRTPCELCPEFVGTYLTKAYPHLLSTCPILPKGGYDDSSSCPLTRRLVRLAVDLALEFKVFELKDIRVRHGGTGISNDHLLAPLDSDHSETSSMIWGSALCPLTLLKV
jgi:hypothetical protein